MRTLTAALLAAAFAPFADAGTLTLTPVADNTIFSENGSVSNGAGDFLFAGQTANGVNRRALIRFDVAGALPQGSTIVSASLTLTVSMTISGPVPVTVHRLAASWGEGASNAAGNEGNGALAQSGDATWVRRFFGGSPWTTFGGDFVPTPSATRLVDQFTAHTFGPSLELANDVQLWLDDPASNFGWIVIGDETTLGTAKRFDSRTSPSLAGPVLTIDFNPPCVPANYCTALANSTGLPAQLTAVSTPSLSAGPLVLSASQLPAGAVATFYFGNGRTEAPFANGNRCVLGSLFRAGMSTANGSGVATHAVSLASFPGQQIDFFETWCFQASFRDPAAGPGAINFTDGVATTFCP